MDFAGDVVKRQGQSILVIRENLSSLTDGTLIPNETTESIRDDLLKIVTRFRPPSGIIVKIRVDGAPAFKSLVKDPALLAQ